jgi:hypothetical protein
MFYIIRWAGKFEFKNVGYTATEHVSDFFFLGGGLHSPPSVFIQFSIHNTKELYSYQIHFLQLQVHIQHYTGSHNGLLSTYKEANLCIILFVSLELRDLANLYSWKISSSECEIILLTND